MSGSQDDRNHPDYSNMNKSTKQRELISSNVAPFASLKDQEKYQLVEERYAGDRRLGNT